MSVGRAGVQSGWRKRVADVASETVAKRTPFGPDEVRALLGLAFIALSLYYLATTARRAGRRV
ncbi:MAG: hypothetical protein M3312_08080 [Actinomycetota bacterium]|nr:hypothetical protein [Actinomycetota bacterium]